MLDIGSDFFKRTSMYSDFEKKHLNRLSGMAGHVADYGLNKPRVRKVITKLQLAEEDVTVPNDTALSRLQDKIYNFLYGDQQAG